MLQFATEGASIDINIEERKVRLRTEDDKVEEFGFNLSPVAVG